VSEPLRTPSESPPHGGLSPLAHLPKPIQRLLETLDRANLPMLASALTFDAMLAIIPLAILLVAGLGFLLARTMYFDAADPGALITSFLPDHLHSSTSVDPFAVVESVLLKIRGYRSQLTLIAVPTFIWFSTRLFASIRICLSQIFNVRQRPVRGHFVVSYVLGYLLAKVRDLVMVMVVLLLALVNTVLSAALALMTTRDTTLPPPWSFFVSEGGRLLGNTVAIVFGLALFVTMYRYASPKRLAWSGALLAGGVATVGFELAKRLFGLYLARVAHGGQFTVDANIGAALLVILWVWYMSLVFLIGAAAADVWDHMRTAKVTAAAAAAVTG
jgi:membrane protein